MKELRSLRLYPLCGSIYKMGILLVSKAAWGSPGGSVVKNPPPNAGDLRDEGSIPGSRRASGVGSGNLLQYSCLQNSMDRGAWRATSMGLQKVWTWT